jgi:hypothetical protein
MEKEINTRLTEGFVKTLGFESIEHPTIGNILIFKLPHNRNLSLSSIGTPNEMLAICQLNYDNPNEITDIVTLHNYDYHGYLSIYKLKNIIDVLNF